jgi:trimethylamine---corrinoid protein Co-methyltransferase
MGQLEILTPGEVRQIQQASLKVLARTGVKVGHPRFRRLLAEAGAIVDEVQQIVRLPETLVLQSLEQAGKKFTIFGRDPRRQARFGQGDLVFVSSPAQYQWFPLRSDERRDPTLADVRNAIVVGDALEHIDMVGAMAVPLEVPAPFREVLVTAELLKGTPKATWGAFLSGADSARCVLELFRTVAGGSGPLRERPLGYAAVEPISPLQLPEHGLEILEVFCEAGLPAVFFPMTQTSATGPSTLAGTLVQENAEILSGIVVSQVLRPGTPVVYGGIPHIFDQPSMSISFGAPEQGLMAAAMTQIGKSYGLPVYVNVILTDAIAIDYQAGMEKGITMVMGALAGADTPSHLGIRGADQGASLAQLVVDDELVAYVKRILRGFVVDEETLAEEVIAAVGPTGNYLAEEHTIRHYRQELWRPNLLFRGQFERWQEKGSKALHERAADKVEHILATHQPEPIDEALGREVDQIVAAARKQMLG